MVRYFSDADGIVKILMASDNGSVTNLSVMMHNMRWLVTITNHWRSSQHASMSAWAWLLVIVMALAEGAKNAVPGVVRFAIIAPSKATKNEESLGAILPSVNLAAQAIAQPNGSLPGWNITIQNRDSKCSSTDGPLAAFELHDKSGECNNFIKYSATSIWTLLK